MRLTCAVYVLALLALVALVYGPGESFWPVTLFLFGPRWVLAVPLIPLALVALIVDRRLLAVLVLVTVALAEPLFGFSIPWRRPWTTAATDDEAAVRLATWNTGGGRLSREDLQVFLEVERPDIVVLQECSAEMLDQPGPWHRHQARGMCLLSRFPILEVAERDPGDMWVMSGSGAIVRYALDTPVGRVDVTNVHLETPREGIEAILGSKLAGVPVLEEKNEQRAIEARLARRWADDSPGGLRVVAGDFNTPVESDLFRDYWGGFRDCHSEAGWGFGFTKHTRRIGVRIDHVLAGRGWDCTGSRVGKSWGGDHEPVTATLRPR